MAVKDEAPTTEPSNLSLLAQERYGADYHGEVTEPEEPAPDETPEDGPEEEPEGDPEDGPEPEGDHDGEAEEEPEGEPEYSEYQLSDIAQLLGVEETNLDVNDDGRVILKGKVDGEAVTTPVKDLLDNYQIHQAADKRLEEAKTKSQQAKQEFEQKQQELQGEFAKAAKLIESAESMLSEDTKSIDWADLRENDPAEYSAKKTEIAERQKRIDQMKQEAAQTWQETLQQQQQQSQAQLQEVLQQEHEKLLEKMPDWKDPDKAKSEKAKLTEYLQQQGFSQQDVASAADHRLIVIADKARRYDELQAGKDTTRKKVAKVPKVMKPGAPKPESERKQQKVKEARARLGKTGSLDDAYALLKARRAQ